MFVVLAKSLSVVITIPSIVFSGPMLSLTFLLSLIYELKVLGSCLGILAMFNSILRFSGFTILLTCRLASIVSSLLIFLFVSYAVCLLKIACLTSLLIHNGLLTVVHFLGCVFSFQ